MTGQRLGIMGGRFDPVHRGHIAAAVCARESLQLDQLRLLPTGSPPHRDAALASGQQRIDMLSLAIAGESGLTVDDREFKRAGPSYTVDTLESVRRDFPDAILVLVLGRDAFGSLPEWHRWLELFQLCHLFIVSRPGRFMASRPDPLNLSAAIPAELSAELSRRQVSSAEALFDHGHGRILMTEALALDISSTAVRTNLEHGEAVEDALAEPVVSYIKKHHLYQSLSKQPSMR